MDATAAITTTVSKPASTTESEYNSTDTDTTTTIYLASIKNLQ